MTDFLLDTLKQLDSYKGLIDNIKKEISPLATYGIIDENLGHFIYGLNTHLKKQIILITDNEAKARHLYEDIKSLGKTNVDLLPSREIIFYDIDASSHDNRKQRLSVISKLINKEEGIIITTVEAILDKIIAKDIFEKAMLEIRFGEEINLDKLLKNFLNSGYERVAMVEAVGQFSLRGGIIDFFPAHSQNPYRIELFDEEVDSIRSFDILTQRSLEIVDKVTVTPVEEILIVDKFKRQVILNLEKDLKKHEGNERIEEKFNKYMDQLEEGGSTNNQMVQAYIPDEFLTSIIDYISREALIFLDEPGRIREKAEDIQEDRRLKLTDLLEAGEVMISHFHMWYKYEELLGKLEKKPLIINSSLLRDPGDFSLKGIYNFTVKSTINYHNKLGLLTEDINHLLYRGYKVIILAGTKDRGLRLQKDLQDFNINSSFFEKRVGRIKSGQLFITIGSLKKGFEYVDNKLIVISDKEIFGAQKKKRGRSKKRKDQKVLNIADLNVGDYIVHENHGIGRYEGIEQLDIQGIKKDYLTIRYRDQDKLYIPIDQMNLIQKYVGSDAAKPRINRLNSGEWQRTKGRARKAVEDMAEDLLKLYAKRANLKGHAFSKDSPWQKQFEDLFPFEETEGQINSTLEIKKDMEKPKPMDRLLCGDVGYGKTEVALRAAFKALIDGKQVAILVPTTILAQQHYNTIIDRFGDFPVEVALLSRFRTAKEQKQTIEGLKNGTIDMVVGTHRLLSKDISFKDLGLLIIDEEQRFGVKHKEKLKKFRESIDVLTLTATPIPRTLHMSLVGIRDMSVIEEPPEERYPIQTYVLEYNPQMIRSAILKEIDRGGQVYFVYNRVETIEKMALELRELIPEAKFAVAHGQMGERQLEQVMLDFIDKKQDVLVCTTIIETGLDIPNVNTIIVYNADKMGLSQLYQLRGRVGRSDRIAYGYFTYEKDKVLTEVAERRLRAIKEFTEFGSGFKIAMRDLEIRGAGNLLGVEQHGHIEAIGYDLYVKFLGEAIRRLKGEKVVEAIDTTIDINIDGYIPVNYIEDEELKIEVYKKIASISDLEEYRELIDELIDRFGDIPIEVQNLIDISYIKALASRNQIKNISQTNNEIKLDLVSNDKLPVELIHLLSEKYGKAMSFDLSSNPYIKLKTSKKLIVALKELVEFIDNFHKNKK